MVNYLSGNIIEGSSALTETPPQTSWKELARATAGSGGSGSLTTSAFTVKDNLMILYNCAGADPRLRVGTGGTIDDTGTDGTDGKYCQRSNEYFGANDNNPTSFDHRNYASINGGASMANNESIFGTIIIANKDGVPKLMQHESVDNAPNLGDDTPTGSYERAMKWQNNGQINIVRMYSTGTMQEGSEIIVLGCDNDETETTGANASPTHTDTNFWQQLEPTVTLSATSNSIESGTIPKKKYLYLDLTLIADGTISGSDLQFNGDTSASYNRRYHTGGGGDASTDGGNSGETTLGGGSGGVITQNFWYIFNDDMSGREKLAIGEGGWGATGGGATMYRRENTGKWDNTTDQIEKILVKENGSGGWASGSTLKIWGSD